MVQSGDTLAFRLSDARPGFWRGLVVVMLGFMIITIGGVGFGFLALAILRQSIVLGLLLAAIALFICWFGLWILSKCVAELRVATVVAPTIVEISVNPLHPGQAVEVLVAQAGPLRSRTWRVDLVGEEHSVTWGTAPDPYNAQGTTIQPYVQSRPVCVVEIAPPGELMINMNTQYRQQWTVSIPADALPQTWSRTRSVTWAIVVQGDANGWPRFKCSFPVALVDRPRDEMELG